MKLTAIILLGVSVLLAAGVDGYGRDDVDDHEDECEIEKDEGTCQEKHERFFFDKRMKCCRGFIHRGCRRNNNNFHSRSDCYKRCGGHTNRVPDVDTEYNRMEIKMENPFSFFTMHREEYLKNFKVAVASHLPISTREINVKRVSPGSTIMFVEIMRSFKDDSLVKFIAKIKAGEFTFVVAGQTVKSANGQRVKHKSFESEMHRRWRLRKIAMITVPIVSLIGIMVALVVAIKVMKHKNVKAGPIETASSDIQPTWRSNYPDTISMEKKFPPTDFVTADDAACPPAYESAISPPPPYASQATLREHSNAEEKPSNSSQNIRA